MLDLGCRSAQLTRDLNGDWMDIDRVSDSPATMIEGDIRDAPQVFADKNYDLLIMTDVIEHLTQSDGGKLLKRLLQKRPKGRSICSGALIFTPTGELDIGRPGPHAHHSGWYPEDFYAKGFVVWEWPVWHRFADQSIRGVFFAWKLRKTTTASDVSKLSGVTI